MVKILTIALGVFLGLTINKCIGDIAYSLAEKVPCENYKNHIEIPARCIAYYTLKENMPDANQH